LPAQEPCRAAAAQGDSGISSGTGRGRPKAEGRAEAGAIFFICTLYTKLDFYGVHGIMNPVSSKKNYARWCI